MSHRSGDSFLRQRYCECCGDQLTLTEQVEIGSRCEICDSRVEDLKRGIERPATVAKMAVGCLPEVVCAILGLAIAIIAYTTVRDANRHAPPPCGKPVFYCNP